MVYNNLGKVASYVGKPITIDACTTIRNRLASVRVLAEVPLDGELLDTIPIQFCEGSVYHQKVAYE